MTTDPRTMDSPVGESVSQLIVSPVGEAEADLSELRINDLLTWFDDRPETLAKLNEAFKGNVVRQIMWAMRYSFDRPDSEGSDGSGPEPDNQEGWGHFRHLANRLSGRYSGFAKCRAYSKYAEDRRKAESEKAVGEQIEKPKTPEESSVWNRPYRPDEAKPKKAVGKKPEESLNPCRTPGCPWCYDHDLFPDLCKIVKAWRSAPPGSTFELSYSTVPASFNTTSVPSKTGKPKNAPILDAVTGRYKHIKVPGQPGRGERAKQVLRVTALDAPTHDEIRELEEEHPVIKRIIAISYTSFTRTSLFDDEVRAKGGRVLSVRRRAANRRRSDGATDSAYTEYESGDGSEGETEYDNENEHAHLVSHVYEKEEDKVKEVLTNGRKTERFGYVHSIMVDVDSENGLKHLIEAFLYLNPPPFNLDPALHKMDEAADGSAEALMASVKVRFARMRARPDEDGTEKRAQKESLRRNNRATDPNWVDPKNFDQRPTDPDELRRRAEKRTRERLEARARAEKLVLEELEEQVVVPLPKTRSETRNRYAAQLGTFRSARRSFTAEQILHDEHWGFTPLFRYTRAVHDNLADVQQETSDAARLELVTWPLAREIFADQLGSL